MRAETPGRASDAVQRGGSSLGRRPLVGGPRLPRPGERHPGPGPKVVLVGDSIRLGYAAGVAARLSGKAVVVSPPENGGDSVNVLAHLDEWVVRQKPDVVHLNCGLHDLKTSRGNGRRQVEPDRYVENLRRIVARVRESTDAALVFADTTPILDERHARRGADFDRTEADVRRYNAAAATVMGELGVPVHDLHWVVNQGGVETMLGPDGTHYTAAGYDRLAEAVADCVLRQLTVRRYRPLPSPASGPEAAAEYARASARRAALVPETYRGLRVGEFRIPAGADAWQKQRPAVRRAVVASLGDLPPRPSPPRARIVSRELRPGYTLEKVSLDNGADGKVSGADVGPVRPEWAGARGPLAALVDARQDPGGDPRDQRRRRTRSARPSCARGMRSSPPTLTGTAIAPAPGRRGRRNRAGPSRKTSSSSISGSAAPSGACSSATTRSRSTTWSRRPEVDASRIGATGISMGSTRAWWLAAVDDRVAAVVAVACLTRYQNLIAHGELRHHGVYYFVNGLLNHFDTEGVLALIAPRPFLALTGELDAGSPADGVRVLERAVGGTYQALGAGERFRSVLYPEVGHTYTPEMRAEMLAWLARWLHPDAVAPAGLAPARRGPEPPSRHRLSDAAGPFHSRPLFG